MRSASHIVLVSLAACGSPSTPAGLSQTAPVVPVEASPRRSKGPAVDGRRVAFRPSSFPKELLAGHRIQLGQEMAKCLPRANERSLLVEVGIRTDETGTPTPVLVTSEMGNYRKTSECIADRLANALKGLAPASKLYVFHIRTDKYAEPCGARAGNPTADQGCEADCQWFGRCSLGSKGICIATQGSYCRESFGCCDWGACTLSAQKCSATSEQNCQDSRRCKLSGDCHLVEGQCAPASDDDCQRASNCHDGHDCEIVRTTMGAHCSFEESFGDEGGDDW